MRYRAALDGVVRRRQDGGIGLWVARDRSLESTPPVVSRWSNHGQGCIGSLGMPTIAGVVPSAPRSEQPLSVQWTSIFGQFVPAFAGFGARCDTFDGISLPLDLTAANPPACCLQNSLDQILAPTPPTAGVVNWAITLPNNPQLLGKESFRQGFCFDVPGYPRFGSMTDGLLMRLGDR